MGQGFAVALLFLGPLYFSWAKDRHRWVGVIGPVVLSYILGITLGNTPLAPANSIAQTIAEATVPLAIVLLLLPSRPHTLWRESKDLVKAFALVIVSVTVVSLLVSWWQFQLNPSDAHLWKAAGMLVGVYTGGTANMSAIGLALDVPENLFVLLNTSDMVLGSLYLLLVFTFAQRLFGFILPRSSTKVASTPGQQQLASKLRESGPAIGIAIAILGLSVGASFVLFSKIHATFVLIALTTFSLIASVKVSAKRASSGVIIGDYLLLVFCAALGSMAKVDVLLGQSSNAFMYTGMILGGALVVHLLLCKLFKVDVDSAILSSSAGVFGPAFMGPIASVLKRPDMVASSVAISVLGLAIGNYLGLAVAAAARWIMGA